MLKDQVKLLQEISENEKNASNKIAIELENLKKENKESNQKVT